MTQPAEDHGPDRDDGAAGRERAHGPEGAVVSLMPGSDETGAGPRPTEAVAVSDAAPADAASPDPSPPDASSHDAWPPEARRTWRAGKLLAGGLLAVWLVAWPLGNTVGASATAGRFTLALGYTLPVLILAPLSAVLTLCVAYALAAGLRLEESAKRLSEAATGFAGGLGPRGHAARGEIDTLNAEIDRALERLASAESLIRSQVDAINAASEGAAKGAALGAERMDAERQALISATEAVGREAESFADAIAERARTAAEAGGTVEARIRASEEGLDGQVQRLEAVSARSLERFETLATAMEGRSDALAAQAEAQSEATAKLGENQSALERAQGELAEQSARLEALIRDQRKRADRLARAVTDQTAKLTRMGQKPSAPGRRGAWRDILATVEQSLPGLPSLPGRGSNASEDDVKAAMDRLVDRMQRFSLTLRTQLLGGPPAGDLARFEQGERLVFVRQLLEEDAGVMRERISEEAQRNAVFAQGVAEFLGDFDALMEPVANAEEAEAAMAEYLRSPLGRLYVLVGTALGRFEAKG